MEKFSAKMIISWLVISVIALIVLLVSLNALERESNDDSNNDNVMAGHENVGSARLPYIGNLEMYEILNDRSGEGFFVYIGRPDCSACLEYEPLLEEILEELDRELRYYRVDLALLEEDSVLDPVETLEILQVHYVPSIVFIQNGELVDLITGVSFLGADAREVTIEFFEENGGLN